MDHGPAFQALWQQLRNEVRALQNRGYYGDGMHHNMASSHTHVSQAIGLPGPGWQIRRGWEDKGLKWGIFLNTWSVIPLSSSLHSSLSLTVWWSSLTRPPRLLQTTQQKF